MVRSNEIIEEYRKGDFDRRLALFMEYREMRDAFVEIDQKEYTSGNRKYAGETAKTGHRFCSGLLSSLPGFPLLQRGIKGDFRTVAQKSPLPPFKKGVDNDFSDLSTELNSPDRFCWGLKAFCQ